VSAGVFRLEQLAIVRPCVFVYANATTYNSSPSLNVPRFSYRDHGPALPLLSMRGKTNKSDEFAAAIALIKLLGLKMADKLITITTAREGRRKRRGGGTKWSDVVEKGHFDY
jgi:hypothetical protein